MPWGTSPGREGRDFSRCYGNPGSWSTRPQVGYRYGGRGGRRCTRVRSLAYASTMTHRCTDVHTNSCPQTLFLCTSYSLHVQAASLHTHRSLHNRYLETPSKSRTHSAIRKAEGQVDTHTLSKPYADPHISSTQSYTQPQNYTRTQEIHRHRQKDGHPNTDPQKYTHRHTGRYTPLKSRTQ